MRKGKKDQVVKDKAKNKGNKAKYAGSRAELAETSPVSQHIIRTCLNMQMEKKITTKEDGRFLVYYHFPETASEEETQVFESIEGNSGEEDRRQKTEDSLSTIDNPNTQHPTPNPGGVPNV